jgi:hypothetical protein
MSYNIYIIDTTSPLVRIVPELASGGGLELKWNGGDKKEELAIVSSEFNFNMLDPTHQDAAFIAFYTGNETKWKVQIEDDRDNAIIWQGFVLPDLYNEPYKNGNLFVNFTATDGLGRLKGKYLSDEYYIREKSVIDIFSQILRLTGLELELYFAPAIENFLVKNWNLIYIDTETFLDKDKKLDAYTILETLLKDTLCVCYQADNRWYIEGINMRHVRKTTYKSYDTFGNFLATVVYDRLVKRIMALDEPTVTIIPPYNEITVTHKKTAPGLPKTVAKSVNDGWALVTGVNGELFPQDWMGNNGYYGRAVAPDYNTTMWSGGFFNGDLNYNWPQDDTKYISLAKKLYFAAFDKVKIALTFDIVHPETGEKGNESTWNNVMKYQILFNGSVLFSNFGGVVEDRENLIFSSGGTCKIEIEHIFTTEGLLDIRLFRPTGNVTINGVLGVKLSTATIEIIDFNEEVSVTDLINDDFTVDAKLELDYAEDKTGSSKGFRLAKLKEDTSFYNSVNATIIDSFIFEGKNYSVVNLINAQLIDKNRYTVTYGGVDVIIVDVIYNFLGGDRMVIETFNPYSGGFFVVKKYAIADVVGSRTHWAQWTDAFYKIENNSYLKTVANIYRRLFNVAHEKIDCTAKNAVKFNDIIQFNYQFLKDFQVLNCAWNLDTNKSELTIARGIYKELNVENPNDTNIPPIVVAADDIYIAEGVTTVNLSATAYDPDGEIVSQQWTKIEGSVGESITTPTLINTPVTGLTGNFYTFQIEVTDNNGATALDTVNVIRTTNYTVTLDLIESQVNDNPRAVRNKYKLNISPALLSGYVLNFSGLIYLYARGGLSWPIQDNKNAATVWYRIDRNGGVVEQKQLVSSGSEEKYIKEESIPLLLSYFPSDQVYVTIFSGKQRKSDISNEFKAIVNFKIQTVVIAAGVGSVMGLPIEKQIQVLRGE